LSAIGFFLGYAAAIAVHPDMPVCGGERGDSTALRRLAYT